jgi:hypothetical protein
MRSSDRDRKNHPDQAGPDEGNIEAQQLINAVRPESAGGPAPNQPHPPEDGEPTFCKACGTAIEQGAKLCRECGQER